MSAKDAGRVDLAELIRRLEAGTGPDRALDEEMHAALAGATREVQADGRVAYHRDGFLVSIGDVPGYTLSVDAALALVPEGEKYRPRKTLLAVSESGKRFAAAIENWEWGKCEGAGPNYAVALCIAALRAIETQRR